MTFSAENILLIGSVLFFLSIVASKTSHRFGVPALLLFLIIGMLFGSDGVGIQFHNAEEAQFIGMLALSIILFSGGMDTKMADIKPVLGPGIVLSTIGVILTTLFTGIFIYFVTGTSVSVIQLTFVSSLLLAAVMSSTDSASVFSILRSKNLHLKQNLRPLLELESGSNDPMAYMLTIALIQMIQTANISIHETLMLLVIQFSVGAVCGFILGKAVVFIINKINLSNQSLYPILLLTFVFFTFAATDRLHGNGYLAVYIAGLIVGNNKILYKKNIVNFFNGFTWLFQIIMFLTLGLLVNPHELLEETILALSIGIFMIIVARPLTVFLCLLPFRKMTTKARWYISWVGLRGAVPIIFATYPQVAGIEGGDVIFNVVFFITIISLIVQGTTVPAVARLLGLASKETDKREFGLELPEGVKSKISEIVLTEEILCYGNQLKDIPLPENTLVMLVKRGHEFFIPNGKTDLNLDDRLLIISDNQENLNDIYQKLGIRQYTVYED